MNKEEITEITKKFSDKHGELMLLRANIVAINKMLIARGRQDELFNAIAQTIKDFEEKPNESELNE